MLISYKINNGNVTNICDIISGGVIIADKISAPTIECFSKPSHQIWS